MIAGLWFVNVRFCFSLSVLRWVSEFRAISLNIHWQESNFLRKSLSASCANGLTWWLATVRCGDQPARLKRQEEYRLAVAGWKDAECFFWISCMCPAMRRLDQLIKNSCRWNWKSLYFNFTRVLAPQPRDFHAGSPWIWITFYLLFKFFKSFLSLFYIPFTLLKLFNLTKSSVIWFHRSDGAALADAMNDLAHKTRNTLAWALLAPLIAALLIAKPQWNIDDYVMSIIGFGSLVFSSIRAHRWNISLIYWLFSLPECFCILELEPVSLALDILAT